MSGNKHDTCGMCRFFHDGDDTCRRRAPDPRSFATAKMMMEIFIASMADGEPEKLHDQYRNDSVSMGTVRHTRHDISCNGTVYIWPEVDGLTDFCGEFEGMKRAEIVK